VRIVAAGRRGRGAGRDVAPVGIGIIGCGFAAAKLHLPALRALREAKIVAAADLDRSRLTQVADRFGIPMRSEDFRLVLDNPAVDAVAVCVPPAAHTAVTLAALEAGKHVLVEKPLALSLDDCDRLIERAARSDRVVTVGFNMRWHRLVRRARTILAQGILGRLSLLRSVFTSGSRFEERYQPWRARREQGGGVLTEFGVHHYDLWRFLLDSEVEEVFAMAGGGSATVTGRMASGVLVEAGFSEITGGRNEFDLFGAAGQLHLSCYRFDGLEVAGIRELYPGSPAIRLRRLGRLIRELPESVPAMRRGGDHIDSYRAEWLHFLAAIRGGRSAGAALLDGRRALEVALAALESAATGRPVACGRAPRALTLLSGHEGA